MESDRLRSSLVEVAEPVGDVLGALGVLAMARTIMSYNNDQELIEKVAVLEQ
jgi:hypothetical protein